ncbi:integrin alpha-2-like [Megalops cyprinoides]|uniref:integrin alpha-2-like n=1 Tax=Megalops cyprinoides TaxID=118141 RepID=UPI00186484A5|nr:integrin alpha-2-like [Megalops cyprinoides]
MNSILKDNIVALLILSCAIRLSESFNVGTSGAKVFSGPVAEQFGYTVQQFTNHQGKWLLVGSPWSGHTQNQKGDVYKCEITGAKTQCDKLNLQDSVSIPSVRNINTNMSLGMTLTPLPKSDGFMTCGPLWAQQCGSQYFYPGICTEVNPVFSPVKSFSPAIQTCGGPMDIALVLDGSNSIWPWEPIVDFLMKLLPTLDIGPDSTQVSIIQYAVNPSFEFKLNTYKTKEEVIRAASVITQMHGGETNTFSAIDFTRRWAFLPMNGGRPGAAKVMVVVTDGESHDKEFREEAIAKCEEKGITRFGIAVLGYYIRNDIDTRNLIAEIKSIASAPAEKFFFNVSSEAALSEIAGTLGDRIFNIEGTGKGGDNFQMEMSQVGFSAHRSSTKDVMMLGAVGAYEWSGTVVHQTGQNFNIFPRKSFEKILEDSGHSSLLGYSVTTLNDHGSVYYVAGAPRSNHSGQVIVYTMDTQQQPRIIDSERAEQIGSYFGSVLCPLDVDKDSVTDILLVGAPMFMTEQKKEEGRVYLYSVTKGILNGQGFLDGPSTSENARFGMAISAVPDLNMDGFNDVAVGAPLEDSGRGVIYIYNGDRKTIQRQHSQKIMGANLDSKLQYFGRSLDASSDLNDDTIPDVSVGAYGNVVQLWSRGLAKVEVRATFMPNKISILSKACNINGRQVSCFHTSVCFSALFRPKTPVGPLAITYNLTLDADLESSRVSSRGLFSKNNERTLQKDIQISTKDICEDYQVYVQEAPDFVNSISLRVDIGLQKSDANPVLDVLAPSAWEFFIPFSKECGSDEVCKSDLVLNVKTGTGVPSKRPMLVSYNNRRLSFDVTMSNRKENAYNARITATYSKNMFFASVTPPRDETEVKCTSVRETRVLSCQVGYPALKKDQQVNFGINFDFNLDQLQDTAIVNFEAKSDSREETPANNKADISIPVQYDSGIILTRETNINFYVVDENNKVKTMVKNFDDIGPEFNFTLKVSTVNFPVSLAYLTVSLPVKTKGGNPLLYVTGLSTKLGGDVTCETNRLIDPLQIGKKPSTASFSHESFRGVEELDCKSAKCESMKCVLKGMGMKSAYFVNVTTRIWNGTFASSSFQSIKLTVRAEVETSQPDLLVIANKLLPVKITITKPSQMGEVPIGVIVGSVLGGLLLLAVAILLLWKFGFFKSKYEQLRKEAEEAGENGEAQGNGA